MHVAIFRGRALLQNPAGLCSRTLARLARQHLTFIHLLPLEGCGLWLLFSSEEVWALPSPGRHLVQNLKPPAPAPGLFEQNLQFSFKGRLAFCCQHMWDIVVRSRLSAAFLGTSDFLHSSAFDFWINVIK